jgi:hypothetical protein
VAAENAEASAKRQCLRVPAPNRFMVCFLSVRRAHRAEVFGSSINPFLVRGYDDRVRYRLRRIVQLVRARWLSSFPWEPQSRIQPSTVGSRVRGSDG